MNPLSIREKIKKTAVVGPLMRGASLLCRNAMGRIRSHLFYRKHKIFLLPNKNFRDSALSKHIFILATGPSIKNQHLSKLAGELCISASNFFVHPDFNKINPEYHIFPASHDPITDEQMVAWFQDGEKHFRAGQKIFIADTDKYLVDRFSLFKNQNVYYYHVNTERNINVNKDISFTEELPKIKTVAHTALYLSMYLGSKEIYLLGVDHDWLLHIGESKHFYQEAKSELVNKGYVENIAKKETDLENDFALSVLLWKQYRKIKEYAERREIKIWNCTPKSLLDVFPRKPLEETLEKKHE